MKWFLNRLSLQQTCHHQSTGLLLGPEKIFPARRRRATHAVAGSMSVVKELKPEQQNSHSTSQHGNPMIVQLTRKKIKQRRVLLEQLQPE